MINYISHKKSKQIVNGLPKLPTAEQLKEGEIAINYANGYETLSIKNSENEIITFSSTEQFEKYVDTTLGNKLGSGFTGENSANTVTSIIEENEKIASASLNDLNERKLDASAYTPTDLSDYYKKEETSGKTELENALKLKANATDLTDHTGNGSIHITSDERTKWNGKISNAQYNKTDKKIYFYSGATTETPVSNIDTTDFIKDGMVSSVEIKDVTNSGSCLVITFNVDSGKEAIVIPVSKIFNSNNYYLKSETSGSTQLSDAFNLKANASDLTAHTGNSTIHITTDERTKWNDAATNSHTHANKAVLDIITAIDKELNEASNNLVVNSAITKVIQDNEKISSAALNDLNEKLDVSAYTPTDLSDYYKKEETSSKTELDAAFGLKANTSDLTAHTSDSTIHITSDERTKWNNAVTSSHTHANKAVLDTITAIDTELSETSNNLVVNSAITKVIEDNEKIASASLNDLNERKLDASAYTPTDLSDYYKKEETSGKTELENALKLKANSTDLATKANTSDLTAHTGNSDIHITSGERTKWNGKISNVQYNKTDKKIYFYSGATTETPVSNIDTTDFIKDGMVSNAEIKDVASSGSCLVITFNADAGKQDINIPVSKIFNPANYYLKAELDAALNSKANTSDLTSHTSDSTIHITSDERTKWNDAATSSHTHANKAVLDTITAIDKELSETSNNLVVNSAITTVILANEKITSSSLNDLNDRKLDASAYTPTDLSDYYKKEETSGKTELDTALGLKANATDLTAHTGNTTAHITSDERTKWNGAATTLASHSGNTTVHITSDERTKWNSTTITLASHSGDTTVHITSDERTKWNNAATSSHTHANKAVLDTITAIDTELSETSNNLVVNSAITTVILANEKITSSSLNDLNDRKLDVSAYTPTDLSDYYKKEETSGKTELDTALGLKANATNLTAHTGNAIVHITSEERTKWNGAATTLASHSGDTTVHITSDERTKWNNAATSSHTHANKAVLDTITAIDTELSETSNNLVVNSAITKVILANEKITSSSLNDLNDRKLDASAYTPTDLSDYYKKEETSGKTELTTALGLKANESDLTAHTGNATVHITSDERTKWNGAATTLASHSGDTTIHITSDERTKWNGAATTLASHTGNTTVHITSDERTKWNNAVTSSHTHANKAVLDTITAIDKELSETSNNLVVNSAITTVILANEKITSSSLNDLNDRKLDASAYTPTDLSDYYKKEETSGKTELDTALGLKANAADLTAHTGNTTAHITSDERTKWNGAATTLASHSGDTTVHITADERTKWNNAVTSSHTHANKAVLDTITAIDTELSETSNNLVVNSAITTVILANEKITSSSLNDLNDRKLDASAYTPTDLSDYYKKEETSGKTELDAALNSKSNTGHTHLSSDITDKVTGITESNSGSTSVPTVSAVMQVFKDNEKTILASLNDLNDKISQLDALIKKYDARITALENK